MKLPRALIDRGVFLGDSHARRFADVVSDKRVKFDDWLAFFSDPLRQQRMVDAEVHHQRPALAGVVKELESHPSFEKFFNSIPRDQTHRHRQTIGVIVKLVMVALGWKTSGKKGFLGGGRSGGLSEFFGKAEHYQR